MRRTSAVIANYIYYSHYPTTDLVAAVANCIDTPNAREFAELVIRAFNNHLEALVDLADFFSVEASPEGPEEQQQ